MDVEVFALCDAATASPDGKLNILGTFDAVMAQSYPATHPQCSVAVRVRFRRIEQGSHRITLHVVDYDGHMVIPPLDATVQVNVPPSEPSAFANLVLNVQQLRLLAPGQYALNLAIDGREVGSLPLFARQPPGQQSSEEPHGPA